MQINNNPAAFYPPVPAENRNSTRLPVTVDTTVYSPVTVVPQEVPTLPVEPINRSVDQQQARFVRNFISGDGATNESSAPALLPRAVQQYLYIDGLSETQIQQQGRLLDELV